jgi:hypothetical protein
MLETPKEARGTCIQILRFRHVKAPSSSSLKKVVSFTKQTNTLLDIVNEVHVPIIIPTIHQRQF